MTDQPSSGLPAFPSPEPSSGLPAFPSPEPSSRASYDPSSSPASRIDVAFGTSLPQRRWTVLLRIILVIPHYVLLFFLSVLVILIEIFCWFAALVLGQLPRAITPFLIGFYRWVTRVTVYSLFLTDRYPPVTLEDDPSYPIQYSVHPGSLNRLAVLFRIILVLPAAFYNSFLSTGLFVLSPIIWLIALINGRLPDPLHKAIGAVVRFSARESGYLGLLSSEWPWGSFGDSQPLADNWPGVSQSGASENESPWSLYLPQASKVIVAIFLVVGVILNLLRR